jgi:Na+-transporting methylmalonyl-CoA/oxaloacetate decarboxylase gamma subunit
MDKNGRFQCLGFVFGVLFLLIFLISPFIIVFAQWEDAFIDPR